MTPFIFEILVKNLPDKIVVLDYKYSHKQKRFLITREKVVDRKPKDDKCHSSY